MKPGFLAAALIAAVLLAGCGSDDSGSDSGEGKTGLSPAETNRAGKRSDRVSAAELDLRRVGGKFKNPVFIAQPPRERKLMFVVEKQGVIRVLRDDRRLDKPFLDLRKKVKSDGTEQGMFAIAFPPNYAQSRRAYISYTAKGGGELRVEEFRTSRKTPTRARPGTRRTVLVVPQPDDIHQSGMLVFGPDRKLYIGSGDGGPSYDPRNEGQDLKVLRAKLLRIEPRATGGKPYGIPKGNPFRGRGRAEIYAYGLRNPWRFSFDRKTGDLLLGDVGQDLIEEIDFARPKKLRGANFGWSGFEGTRPNKAGQQRKNAIPPIHEYEHGERCSVTGGYVVRDPKLPALRGRYVYGDFCEGGLRSLTPPSGRGPKDDAALGLEVPALVSFGEDSRGRIYVVSIGGEIYRLVQR